MQLANGNVWLVGLSFEFSLSRVVKHFHDQPVMTREQNLLHSSKVKSISFDQKQENVFYYKIFFEGNEYQVTLTNYLAIEIISNVSKLFNERFSPTFVTLNVTCIGYVLIGNVFCAMYTMLSMYQLIGNNPRNSDFPEISSIHIA